jgi:hypothetical protein
MPDDAGEFRRITESDHHDVSTEECCGCGLQGPRCSGAGLKSRNRHATALRGATECLLPEKPLSSRATIDVLQGFGSWAVRVAVPRSPSRACQSHDVIET